MTTSPFQDAVGIDTNVFEHLLYPKHNVGNHINELLVHLQQRGITLLTDKSGRIAAEYKHRLADRIQRADDKGNEVYILRYWMQYAPRREITVNGADQLMQAIRQVIIEHAEAVDRIFVYVSLSQGRILVSNDEAHIVHGPSHQGRNGRRRRQLLRGSRGIRPRDGDILTSEEASAKVP